ncbi:hypothetical protein HAX54_006846 [Datura stramonium]|uniref:Uncharacterized protein n=1 Tax=Datura stramonium TaxID=4076 RepID=A0ABS8TC79_DATST|nr:hypothetical protein [Datura stramonium]
MVEFGWVAGVHREVRDYMLRCDAPFNPLRVESPPRMGQKERTTDSEDDSDGPGGDRDCSSRPTRSFQRIEDDLAAMKKLLGGLTRLLHGGASSSAVTMEPKGLQGGVKKIYRTLFPKPGVSQLSLRDVPEYSFLSGGEDDQASDPGDDSIKASS